MLCHWGGGEYFKSAPEERQVYVTTARYISVKQTNKQTNKTNKQTNMLGVCYT